jgi:hypothetical protein
MMGPGRRGAGRFWDPGSVLASCSSTARRGPAPNASQVTLPGSASCLRQVSGPSRPVGVRGGPRFGEVAAPAGVTAPPGGCHLGPGTHGYKPELAAARSRSGSEGRPPGGPPPGGRGHSAMALGSGPGCAGAARLATAGAESPAASGQRSSFFEFTLRLAVSLVPQQPEDLPTTRLRRRFRPSLQGSIPEDLLLKQLGLLLA